MCDKSEVKNTQVHGIGKAFNQNLVVLQSLSLFYQVMTTVLVV